MSPPRKIFLWGFCAGWAALAFITGFSLDLIGQDGTINLIRNHWLGPMDPVNLGLLSMGLVFIWLSCSWAYKEIKSIEGRK